MRDCWDQDEDEDDSWSAIIAQVAHNVLVQWAVLVVTIAWVAPTFARMAWSILRWVVPGAVKL